MRGSGHKQLTRNLSRTFYRTELIAGVAWLTSLCGLDKSNDDFGEILHHRNFSLHDLQRCKRTQLCHFNQSKFVDNFRWRVTPETGWKPQIEWVTMLKWDDYSLAARWLDSWLRPGLLRNANCTSWIWIRFVWVCRVFGWVCPAITSISLKPICLGYFRLILTLKDVW